MLRTIRVKLTLAIIALLAIPHVFLWLYLASAQASRPDLNSHTLAYLQGVVVLAFALAVVVAVLASRRLADGFTRPLSEFTHTTELMTSGQLDERVSTGRGDEWELLSKQINQLAAMVQENVREVSAERARLATVLSTLTTGVLLVQPDGDVILANRSARRLLAVQQDPIGRNHRYVHRNYHLGMAIEDVRRSGERLEREIHLYNPEELVLQATLIPLTLGNRPGTGIMVMLQDFTQERRLQQLKANLIADVSHELRTPVTAIRGFAETLLEGALERPDAAERFVNIIKNEAGRLERLIEDLMELSLIESRGIQFNEKAVDVGDLARAVARRFSNAAHDRDIMLACDVQEEDLMVLGDAHYLEQAISNLVDNAIKYTPSGGRASIDVYAVTSDRIELVVSDTGVGIPADDLPYVFDRFFRVERARSRKGGGTGLGLAIVKHIVSVHGGDVSVRSNVGEGAEFRIALPRYKPERDKVTTL